jgi:hypothetical protein
VEYGRLRRKFAADTRIAKRENIERRAGVEAPFRSLDFAGAAGVDLQKGARLAANCCGAPMADAGARKVIALAGAARTA